MKVCENAALNIQKPPLSLEDSQKVVSRLNGIWNMMATSIKEHELPKGKNNQDRNDLTLAGTSWNSLEKKQEDINFEENPNRINAKNASNVCNTSTINNENSSDNTKRKEMKKMKKERNDGRTLKTKSFHQSKGIGVGAKKSRKLTINNTYGFGFDINRKISEEVDLTDKTHQQAMAANMSSSIIEISDDEDYAKKTKNNGTTVKFCDKKNKKKNGGIDGDTLEKLRFFNDVTIKGPRSISKNVSITTNQSISSLASSTSPLSTPMPEKSSSPIISKPVQSGTSQFSVQEPIVSVSHVTTPLNLSILKNSEILVTSRSSAHSLISQKLISQTSTSKPAPQGLTLYPQQPPTSLLTRGTIIPCQSYSMNLLPSSTRSKIPSLSSPTIPVTDKPSLPTVKQRQYISTLPKLAPRTSQLATSKLARRNLQIAMQSVPPSAPYTANRPFEALSHFNTPRNLPLFRSELTVTPISCLQKSFTEYHTSSSGAPAQIPALLSLHPHQPSKTWHTPVFLTSETTSHTTSNTFVQESSQLTYL